MQVDFCQFGAAVERVGADGCQGCRQFNRLQCRTTFKETYRQGLLCHGQVNRLKRGTALEGVLTKSVHRWRQHDGIQLAHASAQIRRNELHLVTKGEGGDFRVCAVERRIGICADGARNRVPYDRCQRVVLEGIIAYRGHRARDCYRREVTVFKRITADAGDAFRQIYAAQLRTIVERITIDSSD